MIDRTLCQNLQCFLVVHYFPFEALFSFLIAFISHDKHCLQLIKAKMLEFCLHQQFLHIYYDEFLVT